MIYQASSCLCKNGSYHVERLTPSRLRMADKAGKALSGRDLERQFTVKQEDTAPVFEFAVEGEAE